MAAQTQEERQAMSDCDQIYHAIRKRIDALVEEEAEAAAQRVRAKVREQAAGIAATICHRLSVEPLGRNELRITLSFDNK